MKRKYLEYLEWQLIELHEFIEPGRMKMLSPQQKNIVMEEYDLHF